MNNIFLIYKRKTIVFLLLFFIAQIGFSQNCKSFLNEYIEEIGKLEQPKGKEVYFLELIVVSKYKPGYTINESKSVTKMILSNKLITYDNEVISVYKDDVDVYTIMHKQKKIIHSKAVNNQNDSLQNLMTGRQKYFVDNSKEILCKDLKIEGRPLKYIVLKANKSIQTKYNIDRMKYYYDKQKKIINKSIIIYKANAQITEQTFIYKELNTNYKGFKQKAAKRLVFDKNMNLLSKYKNYRIVKNF